MIWVKRFFVALPMAIAAVLTVLTILADRLHFHLEKVAGLGFVFFYPWAWLLDHDWFGHNHSRSVQVILAYALILWIPAMLYSGCIVLLFRFLIPAFRGFRS